MTIQDLEVQLEPWINHQSFAAKRNTLSGILRGQWTSRSKGKGIEFAGYRKHTPADDASTIDWKASLRTQTTLVKEFEEYRAFEVYVLLDVSDTMLFTSLDKLKAEYAAQLAYVFADAVKTAGDPVSLNLFTDEIHHATPPAQGASVNQEMRHILLNGENYGGDKDLRNAVTTTVNRIRGKGFMLIISDFLGLDDDWQHSLKQTGDHIDLLGIQIQDPRDKHLPKNGRYTLSHPIDEDNVYVNTASYQDDYTRAARQHAASVKETFRKAKGDLITIENESDYLTKLIRYFKQREKRVA